MLTDSPILSCVWNRFSVYLGAFGHKICMKHALLSKVCICMKSWGKKALAFCDQNTAFSLLNWRKTCRWWCPDKVCLPRQSRLFRKFSVKDDKNMKNIQWKICLCKNEIFKIPLLSSRLNFSLATILWGWTELNLKKFCLLNRKEISF